MAKPIMDDETAELVLQEIEEQFVEAQIQHRPALIEMIKHGLVEYENDKIIYNLSKPVSQGNRTWEKIYFEEIDIDQYQQVEGAVRIKVNKGGEFDLSTDAEIKKLRKLLLMTNDVNAGVKITAKDAKNMLVVMDFLV